MAVVEAVQLMLGTVGQQQVTGIMLFRVPMCYNSEEFDMCSARIPAGYHAP